MNPLLYFLAVLFGWFFTIGAGAWLYATGGSVITEPNWKFWLCFVGGLWLISWLFSDCIDLYHENNQLKKELNNSRPLV